MRADRLVVALLVLQSRGQVTAPELAEELEVSVKTARRDLEALAMAGFPVYSTTGRNGGWQLLGGARTDLSGLTATEATMLFLVAGPASTATPEAKQALRKLVEALPETFRAEAEAAAAATVLDPAGWGGTPVNTPTHLDELRQAVVDARQVRLDYADREGNRTTRVVHPLGVVKKGLTWYLVADTERGQRTFRVGRVREVERLDDPVVRPDGFDLAAAWRAIVDEVEAKRIGVRARLRIPRWSLRYVQGGFGPGNVAVDEASAAGQGEDATIEVVVGGASVAALARSLAPWADDVDILDPPELRTALADIGAALVARHGSPARPASGR